MKRETLRIFHRHLPKQIRGNAPSQRCEWFLRSSGTSRRVAGWLVLDVSGPPCCQAPITQGRSVMSQKNGYLEVNRNSRYPFKCRNSYGSSSLKSRLHLN